MSRAGDNKPKAAHNTLLGQIDIKAAIDYFGVTELLDNIDVDIIATYLATRQHDDSHNTSCSCEQPRTTDSVPVESKP